MKHVYMILIVVFSFLLQGHKTGNIKFADKFVKEICVREWDTNGDGEISFEEAASVTEIPFDCFKGRKIITFNELRYFTGLTSIESSAFKNCRMLSSITIPHNVVKIGADAFAACSSLTSINIPSKVNRIHKGTFNSCSSLTSISIPDEVIAIGDNAFFGCVKLSTISLPANLNSIGDYAFDSCTNLTSIDIPDSVVAIGSYAFRGCERLANVTIGDGVSEIGEHAFYNCSSLVKVVIPSKVTSIGTYAFSACSSLTHVYCKPLTPPRTGLYAFTVNNSSRKIYVPINSVEAYKTASYLGWHKPDDIMGYDFATDPHKSNEVISSNATNSDEVIPESTILFLDWRTKEICISQWDKNSDGELSYTEAAAVMDIGTAFKGSYITTFKELEHFTGLTTIGNDAFKDCKTLEIISFPDSIRKIGSGAFDGCEKLAEVHISDIAAWCSINFDDGANPLRYANHLYVNEELVSDLVIPESVTSIRDNTFSYCTSLTSVTLHNTITAIGNNAFSGCSSLTHISIPEGVTSLGKRAFSYCTSLTSVMIPSSITSIGNYAFSDCSSLTNITIHNGVCSIGEGVFRNCIKLTSIILPNSISSIGNSVFSGCVSLASINIPETITSIKSSIFEGCTSLTSITIPDSIIAIESSAFLNCSNLVSVTIGKNVSSIGDYAFQGCSSLTDVQFKSATPPILGQEALSPYVSDSLKINIPECGIEAYIGSQQEWIQYYMRGALYSYESE